MKVPSYTYRVLIMPVCRVGYRKEGALFINELGVDAQHTPGNIRDIPGVVDESPEKIRVWPLNGQIDIGLVVIPDLVVKLDVIKDICHFDIKIFKFLPRVENSRFIYPQ